MLIATERNSKICAVIKDNFFRVFVRLIVLVISIILISWDFSYVQKLSAVWRA